MQSPEAHLAKLGVELPGSVDPSTVAILNPTHRVVVNGHLFWTSSADSTAAFRAAPHQYLDAVVDPVTEEWFEPTVSSPRLDSGDETFYFVSSSTRDEFERMSARESQ